MTGLPINNISLIIYMKNGNVIQVLLYYLYISAQSILRFMTITPIM